MKETSLSLALSFLAFIMTVIWGRPLIRLLRYFKVGKIVTITWEDVAYPSATQGATAAGAIPAGYVPSASAGAWNTFANSASLIYAVTIIPSGVLALQTRDYTGAGANTTNPPSGSISYVVD